MKQIKQQLTQKTREKKKKFQNENDTPKFETFGSKVWCRVWTSRLMGFEKTYLHILMYCMEDGGVDTNVIDRE